MSDAERIEQLEEKLAQAYRVIGALLNEGIETAEGQRLLDYFGRDGFDSNFLPSEEIACGQDREGLTPVRITAAGRQVVKLDDEWERDAKERRRRRELRLNFNELG